MSLSPAHVPRGMVCVWGVSRPLYLLFALCFFFFFLVGLVRKWLQVLTFFSSWALNTLQHVEEVADCLWQYPTSRDRWNLLTFLSRGSSTNF